MHPYTAYGLGLQSAIPLPELLQGDAARQKPGARDVTVRCAPVDRVRPASAAPDAAVWATPSCAFLEYRDAGAFLVRDGREIIIDSIPGADPAAIRLYLLGPALALLLHQRKYLVLHASAVRMNGGAVAFVGDKGMGKSTMAAAMHARGHALAADDVVAIDATFAPPRMYPGFPQLKLFPESARLLEGDPASLPRVHPDFEKRARRTSHGFAADPLPLKAVFVLCDAEGSSADSGAGALHSSAASITPIAGQHGFIELVRHSYLLELLGPTAAWAEHFHQAVAVARQAPVYRLTRRRSLDALSEVAELVEETIASAAS